MPPHFSSYKKGQARFRWRITATVRTHDGPKRETRELYADTSNQLEAIKRFEAERQGEVEEIIRLVECMQCGEDVPAAEAYKKRPTPVMFIGRYQTSKIALCDACYRAIKGE